MPSLTSSRPVVIKDKISTGDGEITVNINLNITLTMENGALNFSVSSSAEEAEETPRIIPSMEKVEEFINFGKDIE